MLSGRRLALPLIFLWACQGPSAPNGHAPVAERPPNAVGGLTIDIPAVTIASGGEAWPCFIFPVTIEGPSRLIAAGKVTVGPGMHHGNVMTRKRTGDGVRECPTANRGTEVTDVFDGGTVLFASTVQVVGSDWVGLPPKTAFELKEGYEIVARMHYLNSGLEPVVVAPRYEWYTVDRSDVAREVAPFLWLYRPFSLPPQMETTIEASCYLPTAMHIVGMLAHTHARGIGVDARFLGGALDGQKFLTSPGYDPERGTWVVYDDPVDLGQGLGFGFGCTFRNATDHTIMEGDSAAQEMCMIGGYAYPPQDSYSALASSPDGCVAIPIFQ